MSENGLLIRNRRKVVIRAVGSKPVKSVTGAYPSRCGDGALSTALCKKGSKYIYSSCPICSSESVARNTCIKGLPGPSMLPLLSRQYGNVKWCDTRRPQATGLTVSFLKWVGPSDMKRLADPNSAHQISSKLFSADRSRNAKSRMYPMKSSRSIRVYLVLLSPSRTSILSPSLRSFGFVSCKAGPSGRRTFTPSIVARRWLQAQMNYWISPDSVVHFKCESNYHLGSNSAWYPLVHVHAVMHNRSCIYVAWNGIQNMPYILFDKSNGSTCTVFITKKPYQIRGWPFKVYGARGGKFQVYDQAANAGTDKRPRRSAHTLSSALMGKNV